ncbi:hypothetical protein TNCV_377871 [Trichonephila clavipes]|nr:hypothetical protein TNCV_377871 [Trichonephila clavipes]
MIEYWVANIESLRSPIVSNFDAQFPPQRVELQLRLGINFTQSNQAKHALKESFTCDMDAVIFLHRENPPTCRELLGKIKGKIVFQWVPSHCGLWGNERADFLAEKGTGILQNFRRDLTLHSAKLEIKRIFRESFRLTASRVARDKP